MAEPLSQILAQARSRWVIGDEGPVPDHPLVAGQETGEANLRLLAVAGQYQRLCQAALPPPLALRADLPMAPLPLLPESLRPLARRILQDKTEHTPFGLARLVAGRGHVLHPADWMPPPAADLPEAYRPWQLWQLGQSAPPALTAETWLDHGKADRLARFVALRGADPAAARDLLAARGATVPAEERLALVEALVTRLGSDDLALLQGFAADRSERVQKAARSLLARLGQGGDAPQAQEAAQMFELATEGLLRRRKVLRLSAKAKQAQLRSLAQTLNDISLTALATALGLSLRQFVELWVPESAPPQIQGALAALIARSAGDAEVLLWWQRHQTTPETGLPALPMLYARLPAAEAQAALIWLIGQKGLEACAEVQVFAGVGVAAPVSAALAAQRHALAEQLARSRDPATEKANTARIEAQRLATVLGILGLLLTAPDAALVLQTMTAAGLHPADPQLDRLTLNAALKGS